MSLAGGGGDEMQTRLVVSQLTTDFCDWLVSGNHHGFSSAKKTSTYNLTPYTAMKIMNIQMQWRPFEGDKQKSSLSFQGGYLFKILVSLGVTSWSADCVISRVRTIKMQPWSANGLHQYSVIAVLACECEETLGSKLEVTEDVADRLATRGVYPRRPLARLLPHPNSGHSFPSETVVLGIW